jgi:hypothetical protein
VDEPQLGLFDEAAYAAPEGVAEPPADGALRERLAAIDADSLTPREALALLYELKNL